MAVSMIVSFPCCISSLVMSTFTSGSMPNSNWFMSGSNIGLAEKRMDHPLGISELKGRPEPSGGISHGRYIGELTHGVHKVVCGTVRAAVS